MTEEELIYGCHKRDRNHQRVLFELYNKDMMAVCIRYSKDLQEAKEILLDGFKNLFNNFDQFINSQPKEDTYSDPILLKEWIKKEIIFAAVRQMHNSKKHHFISSTVSVRDEGKDTSLNMSNEQIIETTSPEIIVKSLQQLTPSYRVIYNLHEVERYSLSEISKLLDISEYTLQDSLSKIKFHLRKNIIYLLPK